MLNKKLLITGASGLVGTALLKNVRTKYLYEEIFCINSKECDLRNYDDVERKFKSLQIDYSCDCIHLAARVGGINANILNNVDFFNDNIKINMNVLNACHKFNVNKLLSFASTCVYPENAKLPYKEKDLHNGWPHNTNFGYAFAKRMLDIQSRTFRRQYKNNFIVAIPTNIYGPNDNFKLNEAHVIPDLIHKIFLAKQNKQDTITLWGNGTQKRDFIFSEDVANAILIIIEKYNDEEPINIATGKNVKIKEIVKLITNFFDYNGKILWSKEKSGIQKKPVDISKIKKLGWTNKVSLKEGIKETCNWFIKNYPNIRK